MRDDDIWYESMRFWEGVRQSHDRLNQEFEKLRIEPSQKIPKTGDRVVVAAGLLNMGHPWIRLEAVVEAVGETSYKLRFKGGGKPSVQWVSPVLITDVLESKP